MIRVLSTKKLASNQKQFLLNAGITVIEADFINTNPIPFHIDHNFRNLIFTSQNSVMAVLHHPSCDMLKSADVYSVGPNTASLLKKNGFKVVCTAENAETLAGEIINHQVAGSFNFFAGNMRMDTLPDMLRKAGVTIQETMVYNTTLLPHKITASLDGILFFSPSAVKSFLNNNTLDNEYCFCIGSSTAAVISGKSTKVVIAGKPTIENTIIQCINTFH